MDFEALESEEIRVNKPLVLHEDATDAAYQAASRSIDQLLWQGTADVAKAVTLFGPGIIVLPMFAKVSGVDEKRCLAYEAHPKRASPGGLMDRVDFESKFGSTDPRKVVEELKGGRPALERRLKAMTDEELKDDVIAFQDWKTKANGRLKTLEKRAAWAFLGITPGLASQASIKKAFKRKALELHPDKGGDAERFQLLQEMKELLIEPTQKELEEMAKEEKEREKEQAKDKQKDKEQEKADEDKEERDPDEYNFSSDSSWDADDMLKKMFPKKKKKKKKKEEEADDADFGSLGVGQDFNRDKHEAARRKLHRGLIEMWERAGKLSEEIQRSQPNGNGGDAIRQLRKFVDRFANVEISKLKENDPKKAERIFRRFLEQGSEVICAAGAVDPVATVSCVAMQVNYPLMSIVSDPALKERCNHLIEAIKSLPSIFEKYVTPVEDVMSGKRKEAESASKAPILVKLILPDAGTTMTAMVKDRSGQKEIEIPGMTTVPVELPTGSTVADLQNAANHMVGGTFAPRLFCAGRFLGKLGEALGAIEELREGQPVHCLPSNKAVPPSKHPSSGSAAPAPPPQKSSQASAPPTTAKAAAAVTSLPKPTASVPQAASPAGAQEPSQPGPHIRTEAKTTAKSRDEDPKAAEERAAAERRAKEEVERQAAQQNDGEKEDDWFDDFFEETKKAADIQAEKEREEKARKAAEERRKRETQEAAEAKRRAEEKEKRKTAQEKRDCAQEQAQQQQETREEAREQAREKAQSSLEARLAAQRKAAEAKKKHEKEKKKLLETKKKADEENRKPDEFKNRVQADLNKKQEEVISRAIVVEKEPRTVALQRVKKGWDENWENPCAGERKDDGSAVWCFPCNGWINVGEPFNYHNFDHHCDKVGHFAWID